MNGLFPNKRISLSLDVRSWVPASFSRHVETTSAPAARRSRLADGVLTAAGLLAVAMATIRAFGLRIFFDGGAWSGLRVLAHPAFDEAGLALFTRHGLTACMALGSAALVVACVQALSTARRPGAGRAASVLRMARVAATAAAAVALFAAGIPHLLAVDRDHPATGHHIYPLTLAAYAPCWVNRYTG